MLHFIISTVFSASDFENSFFFTFPSRHWILNFFSFRLQILHNFTPQIFSGGFYGFFWTPRHKIYFENTRMDFMKLNSHFWTPWIIDFHEIHKINCERLQPNLGSQETSDGCAVGRIYEASRGPRRIQTKLRTHLSKSKEFPIIANISIRNNPNLDKNGFKVINKHQRNGQPQGTLGADQEKGRNISESQFCLHF